MANPLIDFSILGDLGKTYNDARKTAEQERTLTDLGRMIQSGNVDYNQVAGSLVRLGQVAPALSALQQGREMQSGAGFSQDLRTIYGGGQPQQGGQATAPPAMPVPTDPRAVTSAPRPDNAPAISMPQPAAPMTGPRPGGPVQSSATVVGDDEGVRLGYYDPPAGQQAAPAPPAQAAALAPPAPRAPAAAPATPVGNSEPSRNPVNQRLLALANAVSRPGLSKADRELGIELVKSELANSKEPDNWKKYVLARASGDPEALNNHFTTWHRANVRSVVPDRPESKFSENVAGLQAKRFDAYITEGQKANDQLAEVNSMREISRRVGSQGSLAGIKEFLGPHAEALGINISGLSDIQAFTSVVQRLAPQNRVAGSGSTSDIEFKGMLRSMPGLANNPEAREVILDTMEAFKRQDIARAEIASRVVTGELNRGDGERQLRSLPNPMQRFEQWRKANPQIYAGALRSAPADAQPSSVVPQGIRSRPVQDQLNAAPENSIATIDGVRSIKRNGQWVPMEAAR